MIAALVPHGIVDAIRREVELACGGDSVCAVTDVGTKERIGLAVTIRMPIVSDSAYALAHERALAAALRTAEMWIGPGVAVSVVLR